jgi:hypothetical protein
LFLKRAFCSGGISDSFAGGIVLAKTTRIDIILRVVSVEAPDWNHYSNMVTWRDENYIVRDTIRFYLQYMNPVLGHISS